MASEDVIELGSSEDELEPAPKRAKPRPNAMVHIPTNLHGVTIKPTSSKFKPISSRGKPIISKVRPSSSNVNIPVKKGPQKQVFTVGNVPVHSATNQIAKSKLNGKTVQKLQTTKQIGTVNPISLFQKLNSQQVVINKISSAPKLLRNPIQVNSPATINKLPPGISVTRSPSAVRPPRSIIPIKRLAGSIPNVILKKQKLSNKAKSVGEVLTVELDDDDTTTSSTASPQWYLTPEQQEETTLQDENNKEPEPSNLVEITIEDSPIKPKSLHALVKDQLSVTIDDSPVKVIDKKSDVTASDEEDCTSKKVPNSKKKLKYPKEADMAKTIEIEIEPVPQVEVEVATETTVKCVQSKVKPFSNDIIVEIEDSPIKTFNDVVTATPKKDNSQATLKIPDTSKISIMQIENNSESCEVIIPDTSKNSDIQVEKEQESIEVEITDTSKISNQVEKKQENNEVNVPDTPKISKVQVDNKAEPSEFHPIYQSFIDLCFKLENSEDMKKIVEKKVKAYYRQCPKEYTESEEFLDMVSGKMLSMKAGPDKMYLYMKDIVDELNLQRKMAKNQLQMATNVNKEAENQLEKESANFLYGEDSEFDSKRKRQIRKLEKTLKKLHRAIQKLEEQEVDFDDEEDSVYLLTERYKERMVRVHAKFCQLTNTKMPSEPRVQIDPRPGQPSGPAKRLERWINKKVPIGTPLPFPDFHDVLRCVREANDEDKLGYNEADIMSEARDLFTRCGSKLQRRRQENEWRSAVSRISLDVDPAENNDELKRKLENNRQEANKKVSDLLNKYADKQNQLKLEGTEIGDKEAEESPVESEEEEIVEEVPLENKNKRKELLRRLLQEKSRKSTDEKENQSNEALPNSQNELEIVAVDTKLESTESTKDKDLKGAENTNIDGSKKHVPGEEENNENSNKDNSQKQIVNDDDENKIESDIDELHLLQKLHSENEINSSTLDSSGSDSPIAISDTLESSNEDVKQMSDVISIENSSYSESELNKEANDIEFIETTDIPVDNPVMEVGTDDNTEVECAPNVSQRTVQTTNQEYSEAIEDILLASTDDEAEVNKDTHLENDPCVNLKDDNLSIGETVVGGIDENNEKKCDESRKESNKISQNEITSIENVDRLDHENNDNVTEDNCLILDDDCLPSDKTANENFDAYTTTQIKCTEANENNECVSLDSPSDENTADDLDKNNDNGILDECVSLSDEPISVEATTVSPDNKRDDEHASKECIDLDDKHLSVIADENKESLDTNITTQSRSIESDEFTESEKLIGKWSFHDDSSPVCDSVHAEINTGKGEKTDMSLSITEINARNKESTKSMDTSLTKNRSLNKEDTTDNRLENQEEVVSEHVKELDDNTDELRFELVTQVSEDVSAHEVDELPNSTNVTEEKSVIKDNVQNV